jgi:hypothetical protein
MRVFVVSFFILFCFSLYGEDFQMVEIKENYTLWEVANKYLKDPKKWDIIVKYNNLTPDPNQILKGKKIKVPVSILKEEYIAARFEKIIGDVRVRGVGRSEWFEASKVKEVFKGDTVRTGSLSYADIRFYTGQVLNLFANSMVVVKPPKVGEDLKLVTGQIKVKDTTLVTISAKITPKAKNTEYAAKIDSDLSTKVEVYSGVAEVEGKNQKVILKEGQFTEVKLNSVPLAPKKIPELASLKALKIDYEIDKNVLRFKPSKIEYSGEIPKVAQQGSDRKLKVGDVKIDLSKAISGYRVQIAKDRDFRNIVLDKRFDVFKNVNLGDYLSVGNYYIRIAYIDLIGVEGEFTKPQEIVIK